MNEAEARHALGTLLESAPAVTFTSADLLRAGRTRRRRTTVLVGAGVAVLLGATPVALRALPSTGSAVGKEVQAGVVAHPTTGYPRLVRPADCVSGQVNDQRALTAVRELSMVIRGPGVVLPLAKDSIMDQLCTADRVERSVTAELVVPHARPGQLRASVHLSSTPSNGGAGPITWVGSATLPDGRRVLVGMENLPGPDAMYHSVVITFSPYLWLIATEIVTPAGRPTYRQGTVPDDVFRWFADPRLLQVAELAAR